MPGASPRESGPPGPLLFRRVERQRALPRTAQRPRRRRLAPGPNAVILGRKDHRHPVVTLGRRARRLGHHHRIAPPPFVAVAPDPGAGEHLGPGQRQPAARLAALRPLGLGPGGQRDQAAPLGKAVAPEETVELVGAGVVDRPRLERLPLRARPLEREAPCHRGERAARHHRAGIAGIDLLAEIGAAELVDRGEPLGDFAGGFGHAVEVAHGVGG